MAAPLVAKSSSLFSGTKIKETVDRVMLLMEELGVKITDRKVVEIVRRSAEEAEANGKGNAGIFCGAAIELADGRIVTGKNSKLMHASSSLVLNSVKVLANIRMRSCCFHRTSLTIFQN